MLIYFGIIVWDFLWQGVLYAPPCIRQWYGTSLGELEFPALSESTSKQRAPSEDRNGEFQINHRAEGQRT